MTLNYALEPPISPIIGFSKTHHAVTHWHGHGSPGTSRGILLRLGADANQLTSRGRTALDLARPRPERLGGDPTGEFNGHLGRLTNKLMVKITSFLPSY